MASPSRVSILGALLAVFTAFAPAQGPQWTTMTVPVVAGSTAQRLDAIEAISPNDVWAGGTRFHPAISPTNGVDCWNLIMHFNGSTWSVVPTPDLSTGPVIRNEIYALGATSSTDVWAAGEISGLATSVGGAFDTQMQILHWNGSAWSHLTPPSIPNALHASVKDIVAIAPNLVWFFGYATVIGGTSQPVAFYWNGSTFVNSSLPSATNSGRGFFAAAGTSGTDLVAVGGGVASELLSPFGNGTIRRFDGVNWNAQSIAGSTIYGLQAIERIAANDIWVGGSAPSGSSVAPFFARFDGTSWTTRPSPGIFPEAFASLSSNELLCGGVGGVHRWNGSAWSSEWTPPLPTPILHAMDRQGSDVWAVGTHTQDFVAFVAKRTPGAPVILPVAVTRVPCQGASLPNSLIPYVLPTVGGSVMVSVEDSSGLTGFTPGSTYTWWMVSVSPDPAYPCGTLVPGIGFGGALGEILISLSPGVLIYVSGAMPWLGPSMPSFHSSTIPAIPAIAGLPVYTQGFLVDFSTSPSSAVLTEGLDFIIGS